MDKEAALANHKKLLNLTLCGPFAAMALIFDRGNKVSPVCILRRSIGTQFIQKVKILVTITNRPARSKWKFVAILFAITVAVSVIVAVLLSENSLKRKKKDVDITE